MEMVESATKLTEKEFNEFRNAVLTQYSEKDQNPKEEFDRYW